MVPYPYPSVDKRPPYYRRHLTQEVNKNGSCGCPDRPDHPLAASVLRRKSMLEVVRSRPDGQVTKTIYRGVIVMITVEDRNIEMEIQTEGDLVFFQGTASSVHSHKTGTDVPGKDNARKLLFQVAG